MPGCPTAAQSRVLERAGADHLRVRNREDYGQFEGVNMENEGLGQRTVRLMVELLTPAAARLTHGERFRRSVVRLMLTSLPASALASSSGKSAFEIECVVVVPLVSDLCEILMSRRGRVGNDCAT